MTRFADRLETRELESRLSEIEECLEALDLTSLPEDCRHDPERLKAVVDTVRRRLDRVDPFLIPMPVLDDLETHLKTMLDALDDLERNAKEGLKTANLQADHLLETTARMIVPVEIDELDGLKERVVSFRRSLAQHLRFYRESVEEALEDVKELSVRMDSFEQRFGQDRGVSESSGSDLERRVSRLEESVEFHRKESLSSEQIQRIRRILNAIETVRRTLRALWTQWGEKMRQRLPGVDEGRSDFVEAMQKEAGRLRSAVGNTLRGWLSLRR